MGLQWPARLTSDVEHRDEREAVGLSLEDLGGRIAFGVLLFVVGQVAMTSILHYTFPGAWARFLPVLFLFVALFSVPVATFLATFSICWALFYVSPAAAVWFVLFMLVLSGVYEDRIKHAVLLASTPVLLVFGPGLGFLPLLLSGTLFRARGGLVNSLGCLATIAMAAILGWQTFAGVIVTGLVAERRAIISLPTALSSILDISWVTDITWERFATELATIAQRWAETLAYSPVVLAQVLLWGLVPAVVFHSYATVQRYLGWLRGPEWLRMLVAQGVGVLVGDVFVVLGYGLLVVGFQEGIMPPGHSQALLAQLLWSSVVALVVMSVANAFQVAGKREFRPPRFMVSVVRAFRRRPASQAEPEPESEASSMDPSRRAPRRR